MSKNILLISIRPQYAKKILEGKKTVELRKVRTRLTQGDLVLVYVSSPEKALVGWFEVEKIITEELSQGKHKFWELVKDQAGITKTEFNNYYRGSSLGVAIFFEKIEIFNKEIKLQRLQRKLPQIKPPQSYRYMNEYEFETVKSLGL